MAASRAVPAWRRLLARWAYDRSYFNQIGLLRDDILYETPVVKEALRRLPKNLQDERQFRISRAILLSSKHEILPKEQWTKYDHDVRYLDPLIKEVENENKEKSEWNKQ